MIEDQSNAIQAVSRSKTKSSNPTDNPVDQTVKNGAAASGKDSEDVSEHLQWSKGLKKWRRRLISIFKKWEFIKQFLHKKAAKANEGTRNKATTTGRRPWAGAQKWRKQHYKLTTFAPNQPVLATIHPSNWVQLQQFAQKQPLNWKGSVITPNIRIDRIVPQGLRSRSYPAELFYNEQVVTQVAVTHQSWNWTTSMETVWNARSDLICSLLQWMNGQYQTQQKWVIWGLCWQAIQSQQFVEWGFVDSSIIMLGDFRRWNLGVFIWSSTSSWRLSASKSIEV